MEQSELDELIRKYIFIICFGVIATLILITVYKEIEIYRWNKMMENFTFENTATLSFPFENLTP